MVNRFSIVGITLLLLFCSNSLLAADAAPWCELKVREQYRFYEINGEKLQDLQEQIRLYGTKWTDGKVYSAMTNWDIHYKYDVSCENGRYSVKSVDTSVDIVYHMPRVSSSDKLAPELSTVWNQYLACLQRHEFGHKNLAVQTASELNEIFASLPSFSSERALAAEITRRSEEKFKTLKQSQIDYDHETRHGETQGAILADAGA